MRKFLSFETSQGHLLFIIFFLIVSLQCDSKEFASVLKLILTLRHGQVCVEKGLSITNTVLLTNIKPNSIIVRKTIIDHMKQINLKQHNLFLPSKLTRSVNAASTQDLEFLKKQEENEIEKEKATQLEFIQLEISEIRLKQDQYKKIVKAQMKSLLN